MPIRIVCESCASRINVPDTLADRKVKCPKCGKPVLAVNTAIAPASAIQQPPPRGKAPVKKSAPEQRIQTEPENRVQKEANDEEPQPKRKKKKKKRSKARQDAGVPSWIWWVGGVLGVFLIAFAAVVLAWVTGAKKEVVGYGLALLIMLPISTVILILSMFLSSALAGGIEFGEVHIVVPKALVLLLVINLISLLPLGGYIALPFWLFGLMFLFKLDLWETRFLFGINWALNLVVRIFLVAAILSGAQHAGPDLDDEDDGPPPRMIQPQGAGP